eukprot:CAMPEP_0118983168 /NCGR_PEP_ID=MMETSP1173-20130426/34677_1 /TAXON_ID=1034831 /ORGANISM="Rhizochromulina marina cf, Strain CCMP1243" /LENGTH=71 /DNA_ID=CAMNT_0006933715 /DNA_START=63 /DNA_END=274 /DNA_ORIENTATION=+
MHHPVSLEPGEGLLSHGRVRWWVAEEESSCSQDLGNPSDGGEGWALAVVVVHLIRCWRYIRGSHINAVELA